MKVALAGSATLTRFTEGILRDGLRACGCEVLSQENGADFGIIQIHGAPAAREADLEIIRNLPKTVSRLTGCIILLHRPDEISDTIPLLKSVLSALPATTGLAMLGDLLIDKPFYQLPQLSRRVIPHGFFDLDTNIVSRPVIIGSHTTWGEMRSVKSTLALLEAIAKVGPRTPVIGYLGGTPAEALSRKSVSAHLEHFDLNKIFTLRDFKTGDWREEIQTATPNTIFLHAGAAAPGFDVTFNVQLYHYGERIRMGESSGSLHASAGIPVIFEMNGSERIENLKTIKVPYSNPNDADAADIDSAARQIATLLDTGEYSQMLMHNREMTRVWNNQSVARLYIDFLESLAK